jgi:hypothetical protein
MERSAPLMRAGGVSPSGPKLVSRASATRSFFVYKAHLAVDEKSARGRDDPGQCAMIPVWEKR